MSRYQFIYFPFIWRHIFLFGCLDRMNRRMSFVIFISSSWRCPHFSIHYPLSKSPKILILSHLIYYFVQIDRFWKPICLCPRITYKTSLVKFLHDIHCFGWSHSQFPRAQFLGFNCIQWVRLVFHFSRCLYASYYCPLNLKASLIKGQANKFIIYSMTIPFKFNFFFLPIL